MTDRLQELEDRGAIAELLSRLYTILDEQRFDELGSVYTDDVRLDFPSRLMEGLHAATEVARARAQTYSRMQHLTTDLMIELDGDRAKLRANHVAFHVHPGGDPGSHYDSGIVHRFEAVRTPVGWRLSRGEADVIWNSGVAPTGRGPARG